MKKIIFYTVSLILVFVMAFCQTNKKEEKMIEKKSFGKLSDGSEVYIYTLINTSGVEAQITNYGAIVVSLKVPDRNGKLEDVVLGYDNLEGYIADKSFFGAIVGRYGNRIAKGKFELDGKSYQLTINDGENHLHGGLIGFHKKIWTAEEVKSPEGKALKLTYKSEDGEQGYPGNVILSVTYTLTDKNELVINYEGTTDKITILNPTHHSYFNLSGNPQSTILNELLMIDADSTTPVGPGLIPTGKLESVEGSPMDFRTPTAIGLRINDDYEQLKLGQGYDHNWVLNNYDGKLRNVVSLYDSASGRYMEVFTDQPGMQFYSGNFLDGSIKGKNGVVYNYRTGLCLEAQRYPDSPNQPQFPSATLKPGETYKQTTIYKFSTK
ncbi:MAG: galactose mutarotase [Ignavibacteriales bacterium]|nr:MAG: galactose mutarotase [Ignavibacteriales bacterium]